MIQRLDFVLPDFTRIAWTGNCAREVWEPRIRRITNAWRDIEWQSVAHGVRRCSISDLAIQDFMPMGARWAAHDLAAVPLEIVGVSGQPYDQTAPAPALGTPFVMRFVVARPSDAAAFHDAWLAADEVAVGGFLGYPTCCRQFFAQTWVDAQLIDTTLAMVGALTAEPDAAINADVSGPAEANILWRWMGIRAVPHLPCQFDCAATADVGRTMIEVGRQIGFHDEMDWLVEILSWPVEWSALHGIAEIKTPILRVSTRTDATAVKHVVRRLSDSYPAEGATGVVQPYRSPVRMRVSSSAGYQRGLEMGGENTRPSWYASDNGFNSDGAMTRAHAPILDALVELAGNTAARVVDLGCGNGALLAELRDRNVDIVPFGVERDPARVARAREIHRRYPHNFLCMDLFDVPAEWATDQHFDIALIMPGRFDEVPAQTGDALRMWLRTNADHVLLYAYEDRARTDDDFAALCTNAGFSSIRHHASRVASAASTWRQARVVTHLELQ